MGFRVSGLCAYFYFKHGESAGKNTVNRDILVAHKIGGFARVSITLNPKPYYPSYREAQEATFRFGNLRKGLFEGSNPPLHNSPQAPATLPSLIQTPDL